MKKLLSLAMALLLCLGLVLPAAASDTVSVETPTTISVGGIVAVVRSDGSLWVWDQDLDAQGREQEGIFVKFMDDVVSVSTSVNCNAAIKTDGSLWLWGNHVVLGDGSRPTQVPTPVKVMDNAAAVHCGSIIAVIKTDGSLWAWGYENSSGIVGNGTTDPVLFPTKILDDVVAFSSNFGSSAAIKSDGSLWMWGRNDDNQLLNGYQGNASINLGPMGIQPLQTLPVKVMGGVTAVSCGTQVAVIKEDQSLWMWGEAKLGNGKLYTQSDEPLKVMDDVAAISSSNANLVVKTDGTLLSWGESSFGVVGPMGYTYTPVQLMDNVVDVSTNLQSAALQSDGSLWLWGYELPGEAGVWGASMGARPATPTKFFTGVAVPTRPSPTVAGFSDVHKSDYYADAVVWAKETGVTGGTSATTFSPGSTVTRAQAVTFLWRAAGSPQPAAATSPFTDVTDTGAYYYDAVLWATEQGITGGVGNNRFSVDSTLTYDQMLAMLCRAAGDTATGDDWSAAAVAWAKEHGLTNGLNFGAKNSCPRSDVVYCLWKQLAK